MIKIIKRSASLFLIIILLSSCNNYYNSQRIKKIRTLQEKISEDYTNSESLKSKDIQNTLKIAKFNLSKIEEKRIDSITMELIYFEYRNYLNCINTLYENVQKIDEVYHKLSLNSIQLKNLHSDYKNSRSKREDLEGHLFEESKIIQNTSIELDNIVKTIEKENLKFNTLNRQIEELINL